jgi:hypothetical protein
MMAPRGIILTETLFLDLWQIINEACLFIVTAPVWSSFQVWRKKVSVSVKFSGACLFPADTIVADGRMFVAE